MKIKVTTTEHKEKEIEINFPVYRKKYGMFYRAKCGISERPIIVRIIPELNEISRSADIKFMLGEYSEPSTEEEFNQALESVKKELGI